MAIAIRSVRGFKMDLAMPYSTLRRATLTAAAALSGWALAGCTTTPTPGVWPTQPWQGQTKWQADGRPGAPPPPDAGANPSHGPAVQVLVNHVVCQLAKDYALHPSDSIWSTLSTYHFVATVNLSLLVMNTEGLNPSFNFISPELSNGITIRPVIQQIPGNAVPPPLGPVTPTSTTFNRTLAISGSLSASQSNTISLSYQIDMARIAQIANATVLLHGALGELKKSGRPVDALQANDREVQDLYTADQQADVKFKLQTATDSDKVFASLFSPTQPTEAGVWAQWCEKNTSGPDVVGVVKGDLLQGDLALGPTIQDGLNTIDSTRYLNVYSVSGPTNVEDVPVEPAHPDNKPPSSHFKAEGMVIPPNALIAQQVGGQGKASPSGPISGATSSQTSFSALVAFGVVASAGGGPNWSLLVFKGPSAGGGGGGGGSGGSSGGGGGGGGGQLLSYSRTATDTLSITFTPTCRTNREYQVRAAPLSWATVKDGGEFTGVLKSVGGDTPSFSLEIEGFASAFRESAVNTATGYARGVVAGRNVFAQVAWTILPLDKTRVELVGVVTNPANGSSLGVITLGGGKLSDGKAFSGALSDDVYDKLAKAGPTSTYWDTLPGCDVATGPYIQGVLSNAAAQTFENRFVGALAP